MSDQKTPDLESECETISIEEAIDQLSELDEDQGLHIKYWIRGEGTDHDFIRRVAPIDDKKPFEVVHNTNGKPVRYPLDGVLGCLRNDYVDMIERAPTNRMPQWGDESLILSCDDCRQPLRIDDAVLEAGLYYHSGCLP